jgi:dephospho-CoA kinase
MGRVITFVGMPGSGKDTCANYLHDKYGWPVLHFGQMVYEEVQRRGLDNVKDELFVRDDMRQKEGKAVLAKHIAKKAQSYLKDGAEAVLLEGLYSWSEYKHLDKIFGDKFMVIALVAPKELRRHRVLDRPDDHRKYTLDQLVTREIDEIERLEKGGPIAYADFSIVNDSTPQAMTDKLDEIIDSLENN